MSTDPNGNPTFDKNEEMVVQIFWSKPGEMCEEDLLTEAEWKDLNNSKPKYTIKVDWFKPSGKYYAQGEYVTSHEHMLDVFNEFREMLNSGVRPGLVNSEHNEFFAILDCSHHPQGYPKMFYPNVKE